MPRYDFTCQECGYVFDVVIALKDIENLACPKCNKSDLFRHFPAPAVHVFYSPAHPRHKRGMVGHKILPVEPQFRPDAPYLKRKKNLVNRDCTKFSNDSFRKKK